MGWKILDATGAEKTATGNGVSTPTKTILTASSGTYTPPVGCTEIFVECVGQGGGGGGVNNTSSGQVAVAGGGGGGAYAASLIQNPGSSFAYTVGQAANGAAAGANNGTAGANTTFGGTLIVAVGGSPGTGSSNQAAPEYTAGGNGGAAASCTGQITISGGGGGAGQAPVANGFAPGGGYGGAGAVYGQETAYNSSNAANGQPGQPYGGGGSGGVRTASTGSHSGGNGAAGVIIITEYYGTPTASTIPVQAPTQTILTASSGTYTTPANCAYIVVEAIGGGGGGGSCNSGPASGGGGGGGAYAKKTIQNPSTTYAYVIGQGGTSNSYPTTANAGGDTTFGGTVVVAKGGGGGAAGGTVTPPVPGGGPISGGSAGSSTGDITIDGGNSIVGFSMASTWVLGGIGGPGAGPYGGKPSNQRDSGTVVGANGELYGGGGGGATAISGGATQLGGTGAQGIIVVTEYYSQPQQYIAASSSPKFTSQDINSGPPTNPVNGDIWYATAAGGSGEVWTFRYNANSVSAYKWEFVGGSPIYVSYDYPGGLSIGNSTFTAITGLSLTTVRAGDYIFAANGQIGSGAVGQPEAIMQLFVNGGAIAGAYFGFPELSGSTSAPLDPMAGHFKVLGASANDVYTLRAYSSSTGTNQVNFARLQVIPVRVA